MKFEKALKRLRLGDKVRRTIWDKNEYLRLSVNFDWQQSVEGVEEIQQVWDGPQRVIMKWKPINDDLLAEDWVML